MTKFFIVPYLVILSILLASCSKTELENLYSQQDKNIESLVKSLAPESSDASVDYFGGSVRVTVTHGRGLGG